MKRSPITSPPRTVGTVWELTANTAGASVAAARARGQAGVWELATFGGPTRRLPAAGQRRHRRA